MTDTSEPDVRVGSEFRGGSEGLIFEDKDEGEGFDLAMLDTLAFTRMMPKSGELSAFCTRGELGGDVEIGEA